MCSSVKLYTDPGVYIRSMATRGALGGLARATRDAVDLLDAAGFDWILVETDGSPSHPSAVPILRLLNQRRPTA